MFFHKRTVENGYITMPSKGSNGCIHQGCSRCIPSTDGNNHIAPSHVCCTKIQNLSVKTGGGYILKDVNLHIHCGQLTAIIGRNGAGKTTFLRTLLNEIQHTGEIHFMKDGCSCTSRPKFGYVPQRLSVDATIPVSVGDLVLSCLSRRPVWLPHRKKDRQLVDEVLSTTETQSLASRRVGELSGGEIQRVMLALAINPVPDILLLDEPVSGVDRVGMAAFYELVSNLRKTHDITILLVSHDLDLVAKYADTVVLFDKGVTMQGTPKLVYSSKEFTDIFGNYSGGIE